ncbi:MAG TPA: hypothetical protein VGZ04_03745 [Acidimicrobiales bacterium]|jgi:hypothetical protein|nr:hypothetical protein [Acidimicrobiales bacterium]
MEKEESQNTKDPVAEPDDDHELGHPGGGVDAVGGRDVEPFDVVGVEDQSDEDDAVGGGDVGDAESIGGEDPGDVSDAVGGADIRYLESIGGVDIDDEGDAKRNGEGMRGDQN